MRFTTLTAKFAGTCRRCKGPFDAGTKIRYGGRGMTYHFAADCPASDRDSGAPAIRQAAVAAADFQGRPTGYLSDMAAQLSATT